MTSLLIPENPLTAAAAVPPSAPDRRAPDGGPPGPAAPVAPLTMAEAVSRALAAAMRRDARVLTFGEGTATKQRALVEEFGPARVRNTPLAEASIAGAAVGAAAMGLRPVVDLLFAPFTMLAMDAFVNHAGKLRHLSGGQFEFPLVALAMTGAGWCVGAQHHHNLEAVFAHVPGLKVAMPSTPADAAGLLHAAIADPNPVLLFLDIALQHVPGEVPADVLDGRTPTALGRAVVRRAGGDATLVGYGKTVATCLAAAAQLAAEGIDAEVVDLVSIKPMDTDAVIASVRRTGRLVVVHEAAAPCGVGAELAAQVAEHALSSLRAPVRRLTGPDAPTSASWFLEQAALPRAAAVAQAVRDGFSRR